MNYVDGFLLPVPKNRIDDYQRIANAAGAIWMEHGALGYWETAGDDLNIEGVLSFSASALCKDDEIPVFAWIIYPSREARDQINAKVMADPRMNEIMDKNDPVFDFKRMAYSGFKPIVCYK